MYLIKDTLADRIFPADKCSWQIHKNEDGNNFVRNAVFYGDFVNGTVVEIKTPVLGVMGYSGEFIQHTVKEIKQ